MCYKDVSMLPDAGIQLEFVPFHGGVRESKASCPMEILYKGREVNNDSSAGFRDCHTTLKGYLKILGNERTVMRGRELLGSRPERIPLS